MSSLGKNCLLKTSPVIVPYRKKSYHSTVVPIRLASVTSLRLRSSVAGVTGGIAVFPNVAASIIPPGYPRRSLRPGSAGRCPDEIAAAGAAQRGLDQRMRFVGADTVAFEARADVEPREPRREMFGRTR